VTLGRPASSATVPETVKADPAATGAPSAGLARETTGAWFGTTVTLTVARVTCAEGSSASTSRTSAVGTATAGAVTCAARAAPANVVQAPPTTRYRRAVTATSSLAEAVSESRLPPMTEAPAAGLAIVTVGPRTSGSTTTGTSIGEAEWPVSSRARSARVIGVSAATTGAASENEKEPTAVTLRLAAPSVAVSEARPLSSERVPPTARDAPPRTRTPGAGDETVTTGAASGWTSTLTEADAVSPARSLAAAVSSRVPGMETTGTGRATVAIAAGRLTVTVEAPSRSVTEATPRSSEEANVTGTLEPERRTAPAAGD